MNTNPQADRAAATEKVPSFELFFEQEHLLTYRILDCATAIVEQLRALPEGERIPRDLYTAMAILVYLNVNFADQTHLAQEEAAIPLAIARSSFSRAIQPSDSTRATARTASGQVSQNVVGNGRPSASTGRFRITNGCPPVHRATTVNAVVGSRPSCLRTASRSDARSSSLTDYLRLCSTARL